MKKILITYLFFIQLLCAQASLLPKPLTLDVALEYARENAIEIQLAQSRLSESMGRQQSVTAAMLPTISIGGEYSQMDEGIAPYNGEYGDDEYWRTGVELRQNIYAGGGNSARRKAAKEETLASEYLLEVASQEVSLNIRQRFYWILVAREVIEVQEANLELLEERLTNIQARFETGDVPSFDVLRAKVAVANAKPDLITARNTERIAVDELLFALGLDPSTVSDPQIQGSLDEGDVEYKYDDLLTIAKEMRPELAASEAILSAAEYSVSAARSGKRPRVDLVTGWETRKNYDFDDEGGSEEGFTAGVVGSWDIWDSKKTAGEILSSKSRRRSAELELLQTENRIALEVRDAHSRLREAYELMDAANQVVTQAEESLRLAELRYKAGNVNQLDVIDAQFSLTNARTNVVRARYNYNIALASVYKAIGKEI